MFILTCNSARYSAFRNVITANKVFEIYKYKFGFKNNKGCIKYES